MSPKIFLRKKNHISALSFEAENDVKIVRTIFDDSDAFLRDLWGKMDNIE